MTGLLFVSLSYATFGMTVHKGLVDKTPPIAKWARGRPYEDVADYYRRRRAIVLEIQD